MAKTYANPCILCAGACCRKLAVIVHLADVARIHRALELPLRDFIVPYVDEAPEERPYVFMLRGRPTALALRPPKGKKGGCIFLLSIGRHRRCGIYEIRPDTCRIYPFTDHGERIIHKGGVLCPHRFALDETKKQAIRENIVRYRRHWAEHAQFVEEWNEMAPARTSFAKLLAFVEELIRTGRV